MIERWSLIGFSDNNNVGLLITASDMSFGLINIQNVINIYINKIRLND